MSETRTLQLSGSLSDSQLYWKKVNLQPAGCCRAEVGQQAAASSRYISRVSVEEAGVFGDSFFLAFLCTPFVLIELFQSVLQRPLLIQTRSRAENVKIVLGERLAR